MLSRKTLGVAGAAILGSAALLAANTANALINLTPATGEMAGKVKIARETLLMGTANSTTVEGVSYYDITNDTNLLDIQFDKGLATATVYYRVTLENMVFAAAAAATATGPTAAAVAGGADGENYIVFSVTGGAATDNVTVAATTWAVLPDMPGNIKVEAYRDSFDALGSVNPIESLTKMMSEAVTVVDGISERGTPNPAGVMADVSEDFMQFVGGMDTAQIGRLRITADTTAHVQAGTAVATLGGMLNATAPIEVTFKGDFSVGTFSLDPEADCDGVDSTNTANVVASTVDDDGDMMKAMLTPDTQPDGTANVDWYLCMMVGEDNDMPLPTGAFTATVEYAALANAMGREDQTVTIGSIGRDGTTVHIPYMTTYEGYNQRIVLSNRGSADAMYTIMFRPEMGVTATATDMAMGTLMAGATMTMKATDLVMLEGGSRTAATINLVANPMNIDVASVIVNRETQDTDTVVHHSGMM